MRQKRTLHGMVKLIPVEQAVSTTEHSFAERDQAAERELPLANGAEDAAWKASFRPHAVIQTEYTVPTQITICALTGGARPRLIIPFDLSRSPVTFVQQAADAPT